MASTGCTGQAAYAHLDANAGIHCGHHGGGHLDQGGVAAVQVGRQAGYIQAHTPTNGNDGLLASVKDNTDLVSSLVDVGGVKCSAEKPYLGPPLHAVPGGTGGEQLVLL